MITLSHWTFPVPHQWLWFFCIHVLIFLATCSVSISPNADILWGDHSRELSLQWFVLVHFLPGDTNSIFLYLLFIRHLKKFAGLPLDFCTSDFLTVTIAYTWAQIGIHPHLYQHAHWAPSMISEHPYHHSLHTCDTLQTILAEPAASVLLVGHLPSNFVDFCSAFHFLAVPGSWRPHISEKWFPLWMLHLLQWMVLLESAIWNNATSKAMLTSIQSDSN